MLYIGSRFLLPREIFIDLQQLEMRVSRREKCATDCINFPARVEREKTAINKSAVFQGIARKILSCAK